MATNFYLIPSILRTSISSDFLWDYSGQLSPSSVYGDAIQLLERSKGGNDEIYGSSNYTNYLYGDSSILVNSQGGNDLIEGGNSTDYIYGDGYKLEPDADGNNDFLIGGNDILFGGNGRDFLYGDGYSLRNTNAGDDILLGGNGIDFLYGDGYSLNSSTGGDDTLYGSDGSTFESDGNYLYGDGYIVSQSTGGADYLTVETSSGRNLLYGDGLRLDSSTGGNDTLIGGFGNDILYGDGLILNSSNPGNDVLWGKGGNDILYGDGRSVIYGSGASFGADIFKFAPGDDQDIIYDYQQGIDQLDLLSFGVSNLSDLNSAATITNPNIYRTVIDFGGGDILTLNGFFNLNDGDFLT
jgi:Ca2+-binding RTX toxin-like protein